MCVRACVYDPPLLEFPSSASEEGAEIVPHLLCSFRQWCSRAERHPWPGHTARWTTVMARKQNKTHLLKQSKNNWISLVIITSMTVPVSNLESQCQPSLSLYLTHTGRLQAPQSSYLWKWVISLVWVPRKKVWPLLWFHHRCSDT